MGTTTINVASFENASRTANDLSQAIDMLAKSSESSRIVKAFAATATSIEHVAEHSHLKEALEKLDPVSLAVMKDSMDNMSLRFAYIRATVRDSSIVFRILFFRSIRRFYKSSARILAAIETIRANMPDRPLPPTPEQLEADTAVLAQLRQEGPAEWVGIDEVLQEDRQH
jgi:hypothetical protein